MVKVRNLSTHREILINPGKGYVAYNPVPTSEQLSHEGAREIFSEYFDFAACINLKLRWQALQPKSENEFEWQVIDEKIELAKRTGKRVMLGLGTVISTGGVYDGPRSLVPEWVYEAGAKFVDIEGPNYKMGGREINRIPVWEDPIFREKNEKFIRAVAERYDGHPQIECVINFTNGNWGEWHHLDINNRPCAKEYLYIDYTGRKLDIDFFRYYVELFPRFFKKTPILMPINTFDKEDELEPWAKLAVDEYGQGFKREGLISIPDCTYAMSYCAGIAPAFGEWQTAYAHYKADGRWSDELVDREIIDGKLTHYNLGYYGSGAWRYFREKREQINYWANHLGYYYAVTGAEYDISDKISVTVRNDGVTATYLDSYCKLALYDKEGKIIQTAVTDKIALKEVGEKQEKSFVFSSPFTKTTEGVYLGFRFFEKAHDREMLFYNEVNADGYIPLVENRRVRVDFESRPRGVKRLTGEFKGIDFGSSAWFTMLRRDKYLPVAYFDNYLCSYDFDIEIKEGTLTSFEAFGEGTLTLTAQSGESVTVKLTNEVRSLETGFKKKSGTVKISFSHYAEVWCAQFLSFTYEK